MPVEELKTTNFSHSVRNYCIALQFIRITSFPKKATSKLTLIISSESSKELLPSLVSNVIHAL